MTLRGAAPDAGLLSAARPSSRADADGVPGASSARISPHDLGVAPRRPSAAGRARDRGRARRASVYRTLRFAGTFATGFSEFDRDWAVVVARDGRRRSRREGMESLEVAVDDLDRAPAVAESIRAQAPEGTWSPTGQQLNRELFAALALQQAALFLLLGLIVLVSTFNVASTLVVLVRERRRDLGVLAALGLAPQRMRWVFLLYGGALGAAGTLVGLVLAGTISWVMDTFELISLRPGGRGDLLPARRAVQADPRRRRLIGLFTLGITLISCWLPSRRALTLDPSAALRYE